MSQMAPLLLATHVLPELPDATDIILEPQGVQGNLATYLGTSVAIPAGSPRLTASLVRSSAKTKYNRVRVRYVAPTIVELTPGKFSVSHQNVADMTFSLSELASTTERSNFVLAMSALLSGIPAGGGSEMNDLLINLNMPY